MNVPLSIGFIGILDAIMIRYISYHKHQIHTMQQWIQGLRIFFDRYAVSAGTAESG